MILDAVTKKLEILLGGAVTANQLTFQCEWVDVGTTASTPGTNGGLTNNATPVDLVPVPGASTQRIVNGINIYNADTVAATVTVRFNDNATLRILKTTALAPGDTLSWTLAEGWEIVDSTGFAKSNPLTGNWIKTTVLVAGTSFITSAYTKNIFLRMVGGGGGGGGGSFLASNCAAAGGGASGALAEKTFAVSPNTAYAYAIGGAGAAGANTGGNGGVGGDTTFTVGGVTVNAKGGLGGIGQVYGTSITFVLGGAGVLALLGDMNGAGAPGGTGDRETGLIGCSGAGGSSVFGGGGNSSNVQAAGAAGKGYGAGGAGALTLSAAAVGGLGTIGCIVVDEYA